MSESTRRGFVKSSATAAAGMTVIGALMAEEAEAKAAAHTKPLVAYVRNARTGEIAVMTGGHERTIHNRKLAAQIARAAG